MHKVLMGGLWCFENFRFLGKSCMCNGDHENIWTFGPIFLKNQRRDITKVFIFVFAENFQFSYMLS